MKRNLFNAGLASQLAMADWHYTTLLAACLQAIDPVPSECPQFVVDLLNRHPRNPGEEVIARFIAASRVVDRWYLPGRGGAPRLAVILMPTPASTACVESEHVPLPTLGDLAELLQVDHRELDWLCALWRTDPGHYHYRLLEKRHGGSRWIECPKRRLREAQRVIDRNITSRIAVHEAATAFLRGASCITHAARHSGQAFVFSLDLCDFFQSIGWLPVFRQFRGLGYTKTVAKALSALCTHRVNPADFGDSDLSRRQQTNLVQRHLPQGAPSSPSLSNAVCKPLDRRLNGLASKHRMNYSRYADDMVFSSDRPRDWRSFEVLIGAICLDEGFQVNYRKTRLRTQSQQQRVTGVVVNQKLNIGRRDYDALKAELHNCARFGPNSQNRMGLEHYRSHLLGRIEHVRHLNPDRGRKLRQIFDQIEFAEDGFENPA